MFYGLSKNHEYWQDKLNLFVALAPVTQLSNTTSGLFKYGSKAIGLIQTVFNFVNVFHLADGGSGSAYVTKKACEYIPLFCEEVEKFVTTHNPSLDDEDRFQVYMAHFPAGASVQSIVHYA